METKTCTKCEATKPVGEFDHFNDKSRNKVRVRAHCKTCRRGMVKSYDDSNKDKKADYNKKYRSENEDALKEARKRYHLNNRERILSYLKTWRKENPDIVAYHGVKKRQKKRCATPNWLTEDQKEQIKSIYEHAKDCNHFGDGRYEVDHIVPIQGKSVCGLHVPWNLQVIPMDVNRAKNNHHDPDIQCPTTQGTS